MSPERGRAELESIRRAGTQLTDRVERERWRLAILRRGVWFIDIPRTSSTSINTELGERFGRPYGKHYGLGGHDDPPVLRDHMTAVRVRAYLGHRTWARLFTFAIVRNPWDRTHSHYRFRRERNAIPADMTFREYVLGLCEATPRTALFRSANVRLTASDFVCDAKGNVIVSHIVRYEQRAEDLVRLGQLAPDLAGLGSVRLMQTAPEGSDYAAAYDPETAAAIRVRYAADIERFDYAAYDPFPEAADLSPLAGAAEPPADPGKG